MKKIIIKFQSENGTEFKVNASGVTYRELLVLARALPTFHVFSPLPLGTSEVTVIVTLQDVTVGKRVVVNASDSIGAWQLQLIADEFYLAAMHQFFAVQNQAMAQAAHNQQALAKLQHGGRGNSDFIRGVGQG